MTTPNSPGVNKLPETPAAMAPVSGSVDSIYQGLPCATCRHRRQPGDEGGWCYMFGVIRKVNLMRHGCTKFIQDAATIAQVKSSVLAAHNSKPLIATGAAASIPQNTILTNTELVREDASHLLVWVGPKPMTAEQHDKFPKGRHTL